LLTYDKFIYIITTLRNLLIININIKIFIIIYIKVKFISAKWKIYKIYVNWYVRVKFVINGLLKIYKF